MKTRSTGSRDTGSRRVENTESGEKNTGSVKKIHTQNKKPKKNNNNNNKTGALVENTGLK